MRMLPFEANSGAKVNNLASFPLKKMPSYGIMNKISHKKIFNQGALTIIISFGDFFRDSIKT